MSLDNILGVAGGAMDAQVIRINIAFSNIANAEVSGNSN
jgi:flagellar basal body rod protein FlgC